MNETEMPDALKTLLEEIAYTDPDERGQFGVPDELDNIESIRTFEQASVLRRDAAFVCRLGDGSEFQITIVQSHY